MASLILQLAMGKLILESKTYVQFSIKSGLVSKTVRNSIDPNLIDRVMLTQVENAPLHQS